MPRFFFDLTEDEKTTVDDEGQDLASPDAAHAEAVHALGNIDRDGNDDQIACCAGRGARRDASRHMQLLTLPSIRAS